MNSNVWPLAIVGELKPVDLMLCATESLLVQTTVVPALTGNVAGLKAKLSMLTVLPCACAVVDAGFAVVDCTPWLVVAVVGAGVDVHAVIRQAERISREARRKRFLVFMFSVLSL